MESLLIIGIGFFTGLAVGFTSIGSGSISTIGLILLSGYAPTQIVTANILNGAIMKIFGAAKHFMHRQLDIRSGLPFIAVGIPAAIIGGMITGKIDLERFKLFLGIMLLFFGIIILFEVLFFKELRLGMMKGFSKFGVLVALMVGAVMGFITGLTALGSGQIVVLSMLYIQRLPSKDSVGTAIFCGAAILIAGSLAHFISGHLDFWLVLRLMIGSLPGIWIGSHYCSKANDRLIKGIIGLFTLLGGIAVIAKSLNKG